MIKSGLLYSFGMGFWGPNGHDGVWHIALVNSLARGSLEMPIFAGEQIRNYHIGFDLILAWAHKLTAIPAHTLYFQILPPFLAVLIGFLTYKFVLLWRGSRIEAWWAAFFVYFAGDFGWVLTLFRGEGVGGESRFWAQQSISTLINPPFAASLVLFLLGLILLLKLRKRSGIYYLAFIVLTFGLMAQIKVYAGILALAGLGTVGLYTFIKKGDLRLLLICIASALLSWLLFLPLNSASKGLIVFQPFWFLETMMAVSDRVGWQRFYEALMNYKTGGMFIKLIPAYMIAFLIFFIGNMGTRMLGIWELVRKKTWKNFSEVDIFLLSVAFLGTLLPMVILQAGTPWNTIQFFYYSLFFMAIYTGIWAGNCLERRPLPTNYTKVGLVLILTIPTTVSTLLNSYLPGRPPAKISLEELTALRFLEKQPMGVVLTYPFDGFKAEAAINNPPRPLYLYESTAYVSAFSKKPVFLEDEVNLDITGFEWRTRREEANTPFESLDQNEVASFLKNNKIKYLYLVLSQTPVFGQRFRLGEFQLGLANIFENNEVAVYRVN